MQEKKEIIVIIISELDLYVINKVRKIRASKEISQVNLSIAMKVAEGAIGKIENPKERAKYNIRHINLLAKALGCSPKDFFPDKPLKNDMIEARIEITKRKNSNTGEPNYEVIDIRPIE
jgi:transcriptional regulator with XRE-family HTH domain